MAKQEFRISIEGAELDQHHLEQLEKALRSAVLVEIARLDFGGVGAKFPGNIRGGIFNIVKEVQGEG